MKTVARLRIRSTAHCGRKMRPQWLCRLRQLPLQRGDPRRSDRTAVAIPPLRPLRPAKSNRGGSSPSTGWWAGPPSKRALRGAGWIKVFNCLSRNIGTYRVRM